MIWKERPVRRDNTWSRQKTCTTFSHTDRQTHCTSAGKGPHTLRLYLPNGSDGMKDVLRPILRLKDSDSRTPTQGLLFKDSDIVPIYPSVPKFQGGSASRASYELILQRLSQKLKLSQRAGKDMRTVIRVPTRTPHLTLEGRGFSQHGVRSNNHRSAKGRVCPRSRTPAILRLYPRRLMHNVRVSSGDPNDSAC